MGDDLWMMGNQVFIKWSLYVILHLCFYATCCGSEGYCDRMCDSDYSGGDMPGQYPEYMTSIDLCEQKCLGLLDSGCKGYTYSFSYCYLKNTINDVTKVTSSTAAKCYKGLRPSDNGGLSGGSILLIIFFSVMFVYILTGTLFMKFKRNAIGSEMFPNKSFWTNCPGLVKDGVRCLISPCSKRGEYQNL